VTENKKPKLAGLLTELQEVTKKLELASDLFARMKATIQASVTDPSTIDTSTLDLKLCVENGVEIPVPLPEDKEQIMTYLTQAGESMGEEVVRLWDELHAITGQGVAHCAKAKAKAGGG
jgi:hypothetical protein